MKPDVKLVRGAIPKTGPFRAGVWLNAFECEWLLARLAKVEFEDEAEFTADLREKLTEARAQAEARTASWAAGNEPQGYQCPACRKLYPTYAAAKCCREVPIPTYVS